MIPVLLAAGSLFAIQAEDERPSNVLVWYDFENDDIETGPYTLSVFEGARGSVSLSSLYRTSGFRSVEIRDVAGDGEFAELQGFFTDKWHGKLYAHFAILIAEPEETFHVAFAGIAHFSMQEHGIGFWLKGRNGTLYQVTAGREERLFEIEPFVWYLVDVAYDVDAGSYDLTVRREGRAEPLVLVENQANAVGIPGSGLRKYSFIGDIPGADGSNVRFYVDDVLVTSDVPVSETPFLAPGRRLLFVDLFDLYQAELMKKPGCVPVLELEDFGFSSADLGELGAHAVDGGFEELLDELPQTLTPFMREKLLAVADWREGCARPDVALTLFRRARERSPEGKIFEMSEVLALVTARRFSEADELLFSIYHLWRDDPRFPALAASIGLARSDLDEAERWLSGSYEIRPRWLDSPSVQALWSGELGPNLTRALEAEFPSEWHELVRAALTADLRFYVLLWQERYDDARAYCERMDELFARMGIGSARWLERRGDAAFHQGDYAAALESYEESTERSPAIDSVLLKLSDVHFQLGNFELERHYRERIYGSLR